MTLHGSDVLGAMREELRRVVNGGGEPGAFVLGSSAYYWAAHELAQKRGDVFPEWFTEYLGLPVLVLPYVKLGLISCVPVGRAGWTSG